MAGATLAPVPYSQASATTSTGSATVTTTSGSTSTTSIGGCGCCSPCPSGYLPKLFSTGGLCPGAIDNTGPVYLAMEMEFTPISPYTLSGFCLPSGKVFVGDTVCDPRSTEQYIAGLCDQISVITRQTTCDGSTFEAAGAPDSNGDPLTFHFLFNTATTTDPYFATSHGPRVCGCNSGRSWPTGWANSLEIDGYPFLDSWGYVSRSFQHVSHTCSPSFSLTIKGTVSKLSDSSSQVPVATVEITFTEATAPFLGTMPKVNRVELPCVNMTATPIDRANCNCPEKFVYGCSIHGKCRPNSDLGDGIRCCQGCQDFEEV